MRESEVFNISTGSFIRFIAIIIGLVFIYLMRDFLAALFFAIIIASALDPAVNWFTRRGFTRILATLVVFIFIAIIFAIIIVLIFPPLVEEVQNFSSNYPVLQQQFVKGISASGGAFSNILTENVQDIFAQPAAYIGEVAGVGVLNVASLLFGGIFSLIIIVVFSFYLTSQEKGIEKFLRLIIPLKYERYTIDVWYRSQKKLGQWFRSQLLLGALVGVLIFFGLTLMGVRQPLFFAFIAAIFEIVPVIGPILAAIPAVASALLVSPILGMFTIILFTVVQQTESHVFVPIVMKKTIGLNPLVVVLALLVGARLGGVFGILLAVPVTAVIVEFVEDWDKRKREIAA